MKPESWLGLFPGMGSCAGDQGPQPRGPREQTEFMFPALGSQEEVVK